MKMKIVNGEEVPLSDADIAQIAEDEQAWEASKNERLKDQYTNVLQRHIDDKARVKNYNDGFACASYVNSTNATWKQEATDFIAWRDACWQYAIDVQNDVESESIEAPSLEDFLANAPILNWSE